MSDDPSYEVGHGKPPRNRRFGEPEGNLPGRTSEQRKAEIANAEKATIILDAASRMDHINAAMLKLLTDSETRGLGAPTQHVDNTSSDGSMTPRPASELTDEQLARIVSGNDQQD
jgi:hypothetical protein